MLALEAQGCDAEDAVAALANLISAQSPGSEDQNGLAGARAPDYARRRVRHGKVVRPNRR